MTAVVPNTNVIDHEGFARRLYQRFPNVAAKIDEIERGLLHLEMAVLARETCDAIVNGRLEEMLSHFGFVDEVLEKADPAVDNAIRVSYLENIFLGETRSAFQQARTQLPPRLVKALVDLEAHFERLANAAQAT